MKLSAFFMMIFTMNVFATGFGQFSFKAEDKKVREVLDIIEQNSNYRFFYNDEFESINKVVNLKVESENINQVLDKLLATSDYTYSLFENNLIVISLKNNVREQSNLQQNIVRGTVKDQEGNPIPGVTIVLKGTTLGTTTDINGNYIINVVDPQSVLVFSFIGYINQEITVGNRSQIDISLEEEIVGLEEVVVVGYGTQKKVNLTGAVSTMKFENQAVSSRALSNVSNALAGMLSGTRVIQTSGLPRTDGATIQIRGIGSLNASQAPLIIIDGQVGDISSLNPNDVAEITVLKDAASAAIYGSRASNGVVLITTKSGTSDKVTFYYSGIVGIGKAKKTHEIISNTADHMRLINLAQQNSGFQPPYTQEFINEWQEKSKIDPIGYPNTDWWEALLKNNLKMNHHFSARGGSEKLNFYTSVGYFSDDGIIPNTAFERLSFRGNLNYKVNDWLELGNIFTIQNRQGDNTSENNIFSWWRASSPGTVPKHPDGRYGGAQVPGEAGANNMLRSAETSIREMDERNYTAKFFGKISPFKGFELNANYFTDVHNAESYTASPSGAQYPLWNFQNNSIIQMFSGLSSISNSFYKSQRHIFDLFSSYEINLGNHIFQILAGFNQEYFKYNNFSARKEELLTLKTPVLNAAFKNPTASGTASDFAMRSLFSRINYNLMNKYLFELNIRRDGSSKFSPDHRWGVFPSFSAGWRVAEEPFWSSLRDVINNFKIRASWGQLGNSGIGNYEWQSLYQTVNYSFNDAPIMGLRINSIANENLTWETTNVLNFGVDFSLYQNWNFELNYYNKLTKNILTTIPIPLTAGGLTPPRVNSAEVSNSGLETDVRYRNNFGKLSVSVAGHLSYNNNKIISYKGDFIEPHGNGAWTEGYPIGIYWIREVDHIVQKQSEIDALVDSGWTFHPSTPGEGDFLYKDNNDDKKINNGDRVLKGNPIPLFNYGAELSLNYKGFDLYLLMDGIAGWDKFLKGDLFSTNRIVIGYLAPVSYLNSWTPENTNTDIPKLYTNNEKNNINSDFFLHDASFLKLKTIQIGYSLPLKVRNFFKIDNLRVYFNLEDYFTFTSYPGQDPENNDQSYPLSKTASLGINLSF